MNKTKTSSRPVSCHRCGRETKTRGAVNVIARHKPLDDRFWTDRDGMCMGSGQNPCIAVVSEHHTHPCRPTYA